MRSRVLKHSVDKQKAKEAVEAIDIIRGVIISRIDQSRLKSFEI